MAVTTAVLHNTRGGGLEPVGDLDPPVSRAALVVLPAEAACVLDLELVVQVGRSCLLTRTNDSPHPRPSQSP